MCSSQVWGSKKNVTLGNLRAMLSALSGEHWSVGEEAQGGSCDERYTVVHHPSHVPGVGDRTPTLTGRETSCFVRREMEGIEEGA